MTPTPPVPEIEELTQRLIDEGCQGEDEQGCTRDDALIPRDQWCVNCLAGVALSALTTERLARQQAEADAIGSRDELNILKVKHAADVLARQQAERERAEDQTQHTILVGKLSMQLTLSEQARADLQSALTDVGITDAHGTLCWVFVAGKVEVASSGGDTRQRLAGLLRQASHVIDDMHRRREVAEQARAQAEQNLRSTLKDLADTDWQRVKAEQARARLRTALEEVLEKFCPSDVLREITPDDAAHVRKLQSDTVTVADVYRWRAALAVPQATTTNETPR